MARIFDWGKTKTLITRIDFIKIFRKEELFMGQRYRRMEDQNPGPGLVCNLDFAQEKGLEPKVKKTPKLYKRRNVVSN